MSRLEQLFSRRRFGVFLFIAIWLLWALLTKVHTHSWQEESRMATVQALVEQGTFVIDHTVFNRTGDKVFVDGHFFSDKTPILSVATAGAYAILHNLFGLTLDPTICVPDTDPSGCRVLTPTGPRITAFYWLTWIFIGGSSALLVVLFWRAMLDAGAGGLLATGLAVVLGLASPVAPYSIVFAGHVPAALCLFAGFMLLANSRAGFQGSGESPQGGSGIVHFVRNDGRWRFFWAGVLISLSANIDLTLALFIIAFGLWVVLARRSRSLFFFGGASVPFVISALINYWAAGKIVPLYFDPKAYDFIGTVLNPTVGGTNGFYSLDFGVKYAYDMLIGRRGVLAFTPMLIYSIIGLWIVIRYRTSGVRSLALAVVAGSLAFTLYLIFRTDNFGGEAWGTRWFVPLVPLLWYFALMAYRLAPTANRPSIYSPRFLTVWHLLFWITVALSFATATLGLQDAWRDVPPLIRL